MHVLLSDFDTGLENCSTLHVSASETRRGRWFAVASYNGATGHRSDSAMALPRLIRSTGGAPPATCVRQGQGVPGWPSGERGHRAGDLGLKASGKCRAWRGDVCVLAGPAEHGGAGLLGGWLSPTLEGA